MPSSSKLIAARGRSRRLVSRGAGSRRRPHPPRPNAAGTGLVISEVVRRWRQRRRHLQQRLHRALQPDRRGLSVDGWSVQYRSAGGHRRRRRHRPDRQRSRRRVLPGPGGGRHRRHDRPADPRRHRHVAMGGHRFQTWLADTTTLDAPTGDVRHRAIVDFLGAGTVASAFEATSRGAHRPTRPRPPATSPAPTPTTTRPTSPPARPGTAELRRHGPTAAARPRARRRDHRRDPGRPATPAPYVGRTRPGPHPGVVTAAYPTGGFDGFFIQTGGTGGPPTPLPAPPTGSSSTQDVRRRQRRQVGDFVEVDRARSRSSGSPRSTIDVDRPPTSWDHRRLGTEPPPRRRPAVTAYPTTSPRVRQHESELLDAPAQPFTVPDNYSTNQYAEIGLATGDHAAGRAHRGRPTPRTLPAIAAVDGRQRRRGVVARRRLLANSGLPAARQPGHRTAVALRRPTPSGWGRR